jgi:hypothetical protein
MGEDGFVVSCHDFEFSGSGGTTRDGNGDDVTSDSHRIGSGIRAQTRRAHA